MSRRPLGCAFEIVETLVLTLVIFFIIQNFVAQPYRVQQQSMEHTLEPDQYVLVDKLTPHFDDYKRGDIVVFSPPPDWQQGEKETPFIKRIIGIAGDTVEIKDSRVYVDGIAVNEPYIFENQPTTAGDPSRWVVPAGDLFVMGDHRANSADSRLFGTIHKTSVIGRAWLRYWPIGTFGVLATPTHPELAAISSPKP